MIFAGGIPLKKDGRSSGHRRQRRIGDQDHSVAEAGAKAF